MKNIYTLIPDIYHIIGGERGWFNEDIARSFSFEVESRLSHQFGGHSENLLFHRKDTEEEQAVVKESPAEKGTLRLSQMGPRCQKALWASVHAPWEAEPLPPHAQVKYAYGHLIEGLAVGLAKATGHDVVGEQDELLLDGIKGHRDCVIDGCVVDVKSCSSRAFQKFKDRSIGDPNNPDADPFGYLDQLDGYLLASASDPLVRVKDRGYLLAIDKQLGHMCIYEHRLRQQSIRDRIKLAKQTVGLREAPRCECHSIPDGKSGNLRLDTKASYNAYKYFCNPNLRTFIYSDGPRYLTTVVRKPDVMEVDRHGKIVYNS
jgi:hypothetical protein